MVEEKLDSTLIAKKSRISALEMAKNSKAAHIGSSLSVIDILATLYVNFGATNSDGSLINPILLSKGHAAMANYAVLAHVGLIPFQWLDDYCRDGATLGGHVTSHGIPPITLSTGSLGHALPFALGLALAERDISKRARIFVVLSDGECDEGSNWEAALFASHHELGNLTVIIDRNGLQSLKSTEDTLKLEPLDKKWEAFGWHVQKIDGHDHEAILEALIVSAEHQGQPSVVIAETIKGKGVSFMENKVEWHYRSPNQSELATAIAGIGL